MFAFYSWRKFLISNSCSKPNLFIKQRAQWSLKHWEIAQVLRTRGLWLSFYYRYCQPLIWRLWCLEFLLLSVFFFNFFKRILLNLDWQIRAFCSSWWGKSLWSLGKTFLNWANRVEGGSDDVLHPLWTQQIPYLLVLVDIGDTRSGWRLFSRLRWRLHPTLFPFIFPVCPLFKLLLWVQSFLLIFFPQSLKLILELLKRS